MTTYNPHAMLVLLTAVSIAVPSFAQAPENLLSNGSFEADAQAVPAGWGFYGQADEARRIEYVEPGIEGARGVRIVDGSNQGEIGLTQAVDAAPGAAYVARASVQVEKAEDAAGAYLQLRFLPSNVFSQAPLTPDEAGEVVVGALAPADTTQVRIYLYTHAEPTPRVVIDDVRLTRDTELPRELTLDNPTPPDITAVKELYLDTDLVAGGKPNAVIVVPVSGTYDAEAAAIAEAIETTTGARLPVVKDDAPEAALPFAQNVIALGNRSTNGVIGALYDRFYTLLDLKYPGRGGHVLRTLHNPFGNGVNAVLLGGSDDAGVRAAVEAFLARAHAAAQPGSLRLGRIAEIQLGEGVVVPENIRDVQLWDASASYGSVGYFGWNSISKHMALYYMTGDERHAREFLRLAFPDEQAKREIAEVDGELIEDKDDPLAGPYHYGAHMMILFWDLIEESPVFTDADRLRVAQAFSRQISHEGVRMAYGGPRMGTPNSVGSRHGQWAAIALYCLGRYFQKSYPDPLWDVCVMNGERHFSPLHAHAWVSGENDNLYWYCTAIAPIFDYLLLTGDRVPLENGVIETLLRGQEALISGRTPDWALRYAAVAWLNKVAYLTGDDRWLEYRNRTGVDADAFRVGQSYWPPEYREPALPTDLAGTWTINRLPPPMWQTRNSGLAWEESYLFMSARTAADASGDYVLLDGFNGAYRNPYHTLAILELRLAGATVLEGYRNQVLTRVDGMMTPAVPMDAALKFSDVLGQTIVAMGEVPDMSYAAWRRTLVQRTGRYAVVIDDVTPNAPVDNLEVQVLWESGGAQANPLDDRPEAVVFPVKALAEEDEPRTVVVAGTPGLTVESEGDVANARWMGAASEPMQFCSVVTAAKDVTSVACRPAGDGAYLLETPALTALHVDARDGLVAELALVAEDHVYARRLREGLRPLVCTLAPIDIDWDIASGVLNVACAHPAQVCVNVQGPVELGSSASIVATPTCVEQPLGLPLTLTAGRHTIRNAFPREDAIAFLRGHVAGLQAQADEAGAQQAKHVQAKPDAETAVPLDLTALGHMGGECVDLEPVPWNGAEAVAVAAGSGISVFGLDGAALVSLSSDGPIRMLRWWPEQRLLLAGCVDEKVIAFDETGARRWVFVSEMDPAVFRAAKTYWFKSAPGHEGIHGLYTGTFIDGKSQAFVGSACTLEILDESGALMHRMPQFWGKVAAMKTVPGPNDSRNLLAARAYNGTNTLAIINNKTLNPDPRGFNSVPEGHTYMPGWSAMNRHHIFLDDFDGDGAQEVMTEINGRWNRVTVWDLAGNAEYDAIFGPGPDINVKTMRDIDTADLDGDGTPEIVTATAQGMLVALTGTCEKHWAVRLESPPGVLACLQWNGAPAIALGCDDGTVQLRDANGGLLAQAAMPSPPTHVAVTGSGAAVFAGKGGDVVKVGR